MYKKEGLCSRGDVGCCSFIFFLSLVKLTVEVRGVLLFWGGLVRKGLLRLTTYHDEGRWVRGPVF